MYNCEKKNGLGLEILKMLGFFLMNNSQHIFEIRLNDLTHTIFVKIHNK